MSERICDPNLEELRPTELAFLGPDGVDVWAFGVQPSTEDIAERNRTSGKARGYTHVVQKIATIYEVYDLKTLRRIGMSTSWTIGIPVYTGASFDAAVMAGLLNA